MGITLPNPSYSFHSSKFDPIASLLTEVLPTLLSVFGDSSEVWNGFCREI